MRRLGLDLQTVFGMPPVEHIALAASLGCGHISTGLAPVPWQAGFFEPWSLRDDKQLRIETRAAVDDLAITISQGEGFAVRPSIDVKSYAADLDILADLGAKAISSLCLEPNESRALDQFGKLAEMVAARDMRFHVEFAPPHPLNTLEKLQAFLKKLGQHPTRLVIDTMHFFRSGATLDALASIPSSQIGYVQLCDVPWAPSSDDYYQEACFERQVPGEGELPLAAFVKLLPDNVLIGLEVPMQSLASSKSDLEGAVTRTVNAGRALLEKS